MANQKPLFYAKESVEAIHVKEASGLLNKAVVTIEMPDIDFEEFEELDDASLQNAMEEIDITDKENQTPNIPSSSPQKSSPKKKEPFRMSNREFQAVRLIILQEVRNREEAIESFDENDPENTEQMPDAYTKEDLSNWFLELMEDVLGDEVDGAETQKEIFQAFSSLKDLIQRKKAVDKIINRFIDDEKSLIELETQQIEGEDAPAKILVLNPNLVLDSDRIY